MTKQIVYDSDGKSYEIEPVDAREYIASGYYSESPPEGTERAEPEKPRAKPGPKSRG